MRIIASFLVLMVLLSQCKSKNEISLEVGESQTYLLANNTLQKFRHIEEDTINLEILFGVLSKVNLVKETDSSWNVKLFLDSVYIQIQRDQNIVNWNSSDNASDSSFFNAIFQPYKDNALSFYIIEENGILSISHLSDYFDRWENNLKSSNLIAEVALLEEADLLISQRIFLASMLEMAFFYPGHPIGEKDKWSTFLQIPDLGVDNLESKWEYKQTIGRKAQIHGLSDLMLIADMPQHIHDWPFEYHLSGTEKSQIVVDLDGGTVRLGESDFDLNGYYIFSHLEGGTEVLKKYPIAYSGITSIKTYFASDH